MKKYPIRELHLWHGLTVFLRLGGSDVAFNRSRDIACAVGRWAGPGCRGGPTAEPEPEVEVEVPLDRIRSSAEK